MRPLKLEPIPKARIDREALAAFLRRDGPFDLEIGCGAGWHPIRYAAENPDRNLIAIERTAAKFNAFASRLRRHDLPNLLALHADATAVLAHDLPAAFFSRLFFLYPNPEPRNPAQRWIRRPFFARVLETCRPGAEIVFATNEPSYFEELAQHGPSTWMLKIKSTRVLGREDLPAARTHFEKKYLERGQSCREIVFICPRHGTR